MTNETDETDFEAPRKVYPDYHFKRVSGDKVQIHFIVNGREFGSTCSLEDLDREFKDPENSEDFRFVIGKATQFLLEERR